VASTITKSDSRKTRAKMLEKFIKVADQLRQIKNFQTMAAVIAGFSHPAIIRLGQTFGEISPRAKEIYSELVLFAKDDRAYKEIMRNAPLPCIPNLYVINVVLFTSFLVNILF
jgi:son of sevenless